MGISDMTLTASGDMGDYQFRFVRPAAASGYVVLANGASLPAPLGVLQNDPRDGEAAAIKVWGVTQVRFNHGTDLAYGDFIRSGSTGEAEIAAGSAVQGITLQAITAATGYIPVLLLPFFSAWGDNTP